MATTGWRVLLGLLWRRQRSQQQLAGPGNLPSSRTSVDKMRRLIASLLALSLAWPALAGSFYVATTGNDANDCTTATAEEPSLPQRRQSAPGARRPPKPFAQAQAPRIPRGPCATVQGAVDKAPRTESAGILIAPGTYPDPISISHRPLGVSLHGPRGVSPCRESDAASVVLSSGVSAMDFSNLNVGCLTLGGAIGLSCRQFTICDYINVRFVATSVQISGVEFSVVSCGGTIWIRNGGSSVVSVMQSRANMSCPYNLPGDLVYSDAFVHGTSFSTISASGLMTQAYSIAPGKQWNLVDSILYLPQTGYSIPGTGSIATNSYVFR
jgi:hypothetical protein